jgi:hypothetical protein
VRIFTDTVTVLDEAVGAQAFRPLRAVNAAVVDSVMTGLARRIKAGPISDSSQVAEEYALLTDNVNSSRPRFPVHAVSMLSGGLSGRSLDGRG